jgi:response regulator RpfG family c-di-GMP phosphodiesterase
MAGTGSMRQSGGDGAGPSGPGPDPSARGNPAPSPRPNSGSVLPLDVVKAHLSGHRALVLDDDAEDFGRMFVSLSSAGCRAVLARRTAQALKLAAQLQPTVVIFSTTSGDTGAAGLLKQLREFPATAGAVLVALADRQSKRERKRLAELGCDGYLGKPVDRFLFATELVQQTPRLREGPASLPSPV